MKTKFLYTLIHVCALSSPYTRLIHSVSRERKNSIDKFFKNKKKRRVQRWEEKRRCHESWVIKMHNPVRNVLRRPPASNNNEVNICGRSALFFLFFFPSFRRFPHPRIYIYFLNMCAVRTTERTIQKPLLTKKNFFFSHITTLVLSKTHFVLNNFSSALKCINSPYAQKKKCCYQSSVSRTKYVYL